MPRYIDFHAKMPALAKADIDGMKANLGKKDQYGVTSVGALFTTDAQAYCISDGPNADAVCRSHMAKGVPLDRGDVHEVASELNR
jgi:hypothetical protein